MDSTRFEKFVWDIIPSAMDREWGRFCDTPAHLRTPEFGKECESRWKADQRTAKKLCLDLARLCQIELKLYA